MGLREILAAKKLLEEQRLAKTIEAVEWQTGKLAEEGKQDATVWTKQQAEASPSVNPSGADAAAEAGNRGAEADAPATGGSGVAEVRRVHQEQAPTERPAPSVQQSVQAPKKRSLAEILAERKQNAASLETKEEAVIETAQAAGRQSIQQEAANSPQALVAGDAKAVIGKLIAEGHAKVAKLSLAEKIALKKAQQAEAALAVAPPATLDSSYGESPLAQTEEYKGAFSLNIRLNARQLAAKEMALSGKSFCLIGAAGTGKTTTQRSVAESLLKDKRLGTTSYKIVGGMGTRVEAPSIAFCAYTRRASANLARAVHKNPELEEALRHNIMTIHALLEYEPVEFWDEEKQKMSMRFVPKKTALNKLSITHLVIEEASMVGLDLWEALYEALPEGVQIIFIGDINQLPPVFGPSILNYALVQLPIVELTEVYRQQGDSLVLANAHNILGGRSLEEGKGFNIIRGKNNVQVGQEKMSHTLGHLFKDFYKKGFYDPEKHIILSPFNKQPLGTDNMNKWIAQFLGEDRGATVYEVIAGFNKLYLAVGDKVMYSKQDAVIKEIKINGEYHGQQPAPHGKDLSRFGVRILGLGAGDAAEDDLDSILLGYENFSLEQLAEEDAERKQQASHVVIIETENGEVKDLRNAGDFGPQVFSLGYVLTVHKAQGCEWEKVFIILHKDHSVMCFRELLYTAVTRARDEVNLIAKDSVLMKAIASPRIKGNTLEDKLEFFNSGVMTAQTVYCTK